MRWTSVLAALLGVALAVSTWWIHARSEASEASRVLPGIAAHASR